MSEKPVARIRDCNGMNIFLNHKYDLRRKSLLPEGGIENGPLTNAISPNTPVGRACCPVAGLKAAVSLQWHLSEQRLCKPIRKPSQASGYVR